MKIKHKHILVPGQRYQASKHLFKNPKVSKNVMGFSNHAQRFTQNYNLDVDNPLNIISHILQELKIINKQLFKDTIV